ncbi:MAG: bifunctional 3,4-dihydroxy 2-butanone 4-phosphate synthase / GTP cyclohydrolase II RibB-RibA [Phormidesmis priestleyi Ana]|uniref:Riboflavin biosynthesis protein RibBA n=1 Tax=Phormidesmis priestleyi Ana TaxID=1666911 RepID=A0A0P7YW86_9CYAN|nr:MAG: bifunctional 3,4-dihydroxy 2-butanone 4-phosphate synthase / GTP cyclohydrolase II RibB-RibA [Phormidesmis priestleyi Ana]
MVDAASAISDQNAKDQNANEFIAEGADLFRQNPDQAFEFDSIESALADLAAGRAIVVVDDEDRENEGDVICAAQFATPDMINFMAVEARGLICLAMTGDRLDELDLPLMVTSSPFEDENEQTAFTVSIDASTQLGVTTGISAEDRARTIQVAINSEAKPQDLRRPGHIFPLRAKAGGVLKRVGHTEAGVDLARLAGLYPAAVICEISNPDGSMARRPDLVGYAQRHGLKFISIADLISYRLRHERIVKREAVAEMPTKFGEFKVYAYRNELDGSEHIALVKGDPETFKSEPVMVRMHSECLTGDALGSLRCDCRMQLQAALKMIESAGKGVVVYLRQEGRGIGLVNKLKAYSLQDMGLDTVEANERLGLPVDQRNYGMGAQILMDLGVSQFRLITNNPRKIAGLKGYGLEMVDRLPLLIEATTYNASYLATKAQKLGHMLLQTYLVTVAIHWREEISHSEEEATTARYERLERLRNLGQRHNLITQEEARSVAVAVFGQMPLIAHLGLDQANLADPCWYTDPEHPYVQAVASLLDELIAWKDIDQLEFLISDGGDPFTQLKVKLDQQRFSWPTENRQSVMPSGVCQGLETQRIYVFSQHQGFSPH